MIYTLQQQAYEHVRPLFQGLDDHLMIQAVIAGTSPGRIYADDNRTPKTALLCSVEGYFLAGDPADDAVVNGFSEVLKHIIETRDTIRADDDAINLAVWPQTWESKLSVLFPRRLPLPEYRYKYTCTELQLDWPAQIPEGYTIQPLDAHLLERCQGHVPEHIFGWMQANWGGVEAYLQRGFGFCMLHKDQIVSWCIGDCASGDRCEVGIHTLPEYRRRGLAAITVAATVADRFARGVKAVGWHCNQNNAGSWKTAEKVGFIRECAYVFHLYLFDDAVYWAESGWRGVQAKQYQQAAECFAQAFAIQPDAPHYWYHSAAMAWAGAGETRQALDCLRTAIERGWRDLAFTASRPEFANLKGNQAWEQLTHIENSKE
jgi:RimJ/RimL family protein N-acetyltransferase